MHIITIFVQTVAGLATLASCGSTKFLTPPESDSEWPEDRGTGKNERYEPGDVIVITWKTDLGDVDLEIYQLSANGLVNYRPMRTPHKVDLTTSIWDAEYDLLDLALNNEDSVYWFMLSSSSEGRVAQSVHINVTAPQNDETMSVSVSTTLTFRQEEPSSTTEQVLETNTEPTTTGSSPSEETSSSADHGLDSGLSRGETAGVTAGAIIGGLLILGGIGWFAWRRLAMRKKDAEGLQHQQQQFCCAETKHELPGNLNTHPSNYARSLPGLYEAP
ncbi:unnamed protein product [Fusarium graminearum]|nr:unnamed protein product [Fusarium graminearum]CAG2005904.1 unnamed protein product [Fusarium graminearum]